MGGRDGVTDAPQDRLVVLAAASLTDVLPPVVAAFEAEQGVAVTVSLAGSAELVAQLLAGAPVDVIVTASEAAMAPALDAGAVTEVTPLARNRPVVVVPAGNPGRVTSLADLADPALLVALCAPQVPCGAAAQAYLDAQGVTAAADTLDGDVRAVLTRVRLGEVDAGIVYRTDALAAGDAVETVPGPDVAAAGTTYLVAVPVDAPRPRTAAAFVDHLQSPATREVLADAGFAAP
nr:molybdate ABC transporter substrate-binding protein [uncultured Actinotalea sp.]